MIPHLLIPTIKSECLTIVTNIFHAGKLFVKPENFSYSDLIHKFKIIFNVFSVITDTSLDLS